MFAVLNFSLLNFDFSVYCYTVVFYSVFGKHKLGSSIIDQILKIVFTAKFLTIASTL